MVYIHFPTLLTEEEEMLKEKYAKLKRKKKALQLLKTPKPETPSTPNIPTKRGLEVVEDAKEVAKKLTQSGVINKIKQKAEGSKEKLQFKRKLSKDPDKKIPSLSFQRYSSQSSRELEDEVCSPLTPSVQTPSNDCSSKLPVKNLYDSFISAKDNHRSDASDVSREYPRRGNTIYVHGYNITEELLKKTFQTYGTIINISMETDKNCGFITFEKMETSEEAVSGMNKNMVDGILLKVSIARRQPVIEVNNGSLSASWVALASNHSHKGPQSHQDKRDIVTYDDDIF